MWIFSIKQYLHPTQNTSRKQTLKDMDDEDERRLTKTDKLIKVFQEICAEKNLWWLGISLNDAATISTKPNQFSLDSPYMSAWKIKMVCKWKSRGLIFLFSDLPSKKFAMGARLANLEANFWSLFYFSNVSKNAEHLFGENFHYYGCC